MADVLTPIMACLGISRDDMTGKTDVRVGINAIYTTVSIPLPTAGTYFFNNRTTSLTNPGSLFLSYVLNAAETALATGATWASTLESKAGVWVLRYDTFTGSASATVEILWNNAASTAIPRLFGFNGTDINFTGTTLATDWQQGRLWLPGDRFPARWESREVRKGDVLFNEFAGSVVRYGHGGYTLHRLVFEHLKALFVYSDRSSKATYLTARSGVESGDLNVSWEKGCWQDLYSTSAPLRIYRDRADTGSYVDVQVWRKEELNDLESVFEETHTAPQRYRCQMILVEGS